MSLWRWVSDCVTTFLQFQHDYTEPSYAESRNSEWMNVAIAIICIQSLILTWVSRGSDWMDSLFQSAIGCPKWSRGYFGTWMLDFHIQQLLLCLNTANIISCLQLVLCIAWGVLSRVKSLELQRTIYWDWFGSHLH